MQCLSSLSHIYMRSLPHICMPCSLSTLCNARRHHVIGKPWLFQCQTSPIGKEGGQQGLDSRSCSPCLSQVLSGHHERILVGAELQHPAGKVDGDDAGRAAHPWNREAGHPVSNSKLDHLACLSVVSDGTHVCLVKSKPVLNSFCYRQLCNFILMMRRIQDLHRHAGKHQTRGTIQDES